MSVTPYEVTTVSSAAYSVRAVWGPRAETPEAIAARFLACADRLKDIHPAFAEWRLLLGHKSKTLDALRDDFATIVAANVDRAESGKPTPIRGYWVTLVNITKRDAPSLFVSLGACAGSWAHVPYWANFVQIKTAHGVTPDPSIIAYPVFKLALLALAESFEATACLARPQLLLNFGDEASRLGLGWMHYVSPRFAPLITPPPSAIVERTARGALFMAATEETFRVDNPAHLAAAEDILAALAPFEALPWPPDQTPE